VWAWFWHCSPGCEIVTPVFGTFGFWGGVISVILMFARKRVGWYRVRGTARHHSVRPVVSAWLTGILAMNTARSSNDMGPSQPTLAGIVAFSDPATDETLVATAKMGDEEAFETLVKRHRPRIFALALRYTRVREDAEDVVQQLSKKRWSTSTTSKGNPRSPHG
jgi:Sigma-70 region 2